jgi:zinc protease
MDRTNYYATVGKDSLEEYVRMEADRMRNLRLREEDRKSEMTVVRNEFERGQNDAGNALTEEVIAAAFLAHPYHHSTIGWKSDIEQVPLEKLREFYDAFYWPDNATAVIVGDVDVRSALLLVQKYYGRIPQAPRPVPAMYTEEPRQAGPRRVTLKRAGELGQVMIAYKAPNGLSADLPALRVLGTILSSGKNSRLSRALVDTSLATRANGTIMPTRDPGLFTVHAALTPGTKHEAVEAALIAELNRIKRDGVTAAEVNRAISQFQAQQYYGLDGTARVASALNEWIAVGDWSQFVLAVDAASRVTPQEVQRVANTYLQEDQSTTGWFVPVVP